MPQPTQIFLSYRRSDSAGHARALYRDLSDRFRPDSLFFDQSSIESGERFPGRLRTAITESRVVLVLIGADWLDVRDKKTRRRRLDDPTDFVRQEIALALKLKKRVIPVLFDDTPMPARQKLPKPLAALASIDGLTLRGKTYEYDHQLHQLTELIGDAVGGVGYSTSRPRYGGWTLMSPEWAFFRSIQADPQDPSRLYAGLDERQGLYRSNDGGRSWGPADAKFTGTSVNSIAVSPLGLMCVGTDAGLWISPDRAKSWTQDSDYAGKAILSVALSSLDPGLRLIGCQRQGGASGGAGSSATLADDGRLPSFEGTAGDGLKVSKDGGKTWTTFPTPDTVNGTWIDPQDSRVFAIASADHGLFLSREGPYGLRRVETFPKGKRPLCVTILPGKPRRILVGTMEGGVVSSDDLGTTWKESQGVPDIQVSDIRASTAGNGTIGAATPDGYYESTDSGLHWQRSVEGLAYTYCMCVAALSDGSTVVGTSGGGAYRRSSGASTWNPASTGFPPAGGICIGCTDRWLLLGTDVGLFGSRDGGDSWSFLGPTGEAVLAVAVAAQSRDEGSPPSGGLYVSRGVGRSRPLSTGRASPTLYVGTARGGLFKSGDDGGAWEQLTLPAQGSVRSIVLLHDNPRRLGVVIEYVGLFLSDDDGLTWSSASSAGLGPMVNSVVSSRHESGKMFAMTSDRGIFHSESSGESWARSMGIPEGEIVVAGCEADDDPAAVFAASLRGHVYRSRDSGARFTRVATAPFALAKKKGDLRWVSMRVRGSGASPTIIIGGIGSFLSQSGGAKWTALPLDVHKNDYAVNDLAISRDGDTLLMTTPHGLFSRALPTRSAKVSKPTSKKRRRSRAIRSS